MTLETVELWQLLTLVRNSADYGNDSDLADKLEKEIFSRIYS